MELLLLYFWLKLNTIIALFVLLCVGSVAAALLRFGWCHSPYNDDETKRRLVASKHLWWRFASGALIGLFLANSIPNRTDTAILVGGHYALKIGETPEAAKIMSLMRKKANEILDAELSK